MHTEFNQGLFVDKEWRKGWFGPGRGVFRVKDLNVSPSGWKGWVLYFGFMPTHLALMAAAIVFRAPWILLGNALLIGGFIAATRLLYEE